MRGLVQKPMLGDECMSDGTNPGDRNNVLKMLLNEGSGNKVSDLSGNAQSGAIGSDMSWDSGKYGSALSFPAGETVNNYITISPKTPLRMDYITIVACVYPRGDSTGNYGGIWWDQSDASSTRMMVGDDGTLYFQLDCLGGVDYNESGGAGIVPMNAWSQVACSWDGVTGSHYVNGILKFSKAEGAGVLDKSTSDCIIGMGQAATYEFDGLIDNVLIYNYALPASEIALLCREPFCDLGPRRFLPFAPVAAGGISMPLVMQQMNHFKGGMAA